MKIADLRTISEPAMSMLNDANEGIVDALLNLTWQRASGTGVEGETVYGGKPSSKFVSGFLLPRFEQTGTQDETSDIHISTHGMDFQIASHTTGAMEVSVSLSVYVRSLPTWSELTAPELDLFPRPPLRKDVERAVTDETRSRIKTIRAEDLQKLPAERRDIRRTQQEIYKSLLAVYGVRVSHDEVIAEEPEATSSDDDKSGKPSRDGNDVSGPSETEIEGRLATHKGNYIFDTDQAAQLIDIPQKWKRLSVVAVPYRLDIGASESFTATADAWSQQLITAIASVVRQWVESEDGKMWAYRPIQIRPSNFKSADSWQAFLDSLRLTNSSVADLMPNLSGIRLAVEANLDLRNHEKRNIRVILENNGSEVANRSRERYEHAIHQVSLEVVLPASSHRPLMLDRIEPSYRFRDFLSYPAIGVNCGVESHQDGAMLHLRTTWMPRYTQPRVAPTEIPGVPIHFVELSDPHFSPTALRPFVQAYQAWIENETNTLDPAQGVLDSGTAERERRRFSQDIVNYEREVRRISLGMDLLEKSFEQHQLDANSREAIPFRAWVLLNKTFAVAGAPRGITSWRLFQMAFILAHIPTFASRMDEFANAQWFDNEFDEETATLLYFPTGGGKSEAFFGLLVFNLFLDRLRGKHLGVTALLRYPLRLLTLQQAQRLLAILIEAELLRRAEGIPGEPFEIGFWVGSGNTPNRADDPRLDSVPTAKPGHYGNDDTGTTEYDEVNKSFNKIPLCPMCRAHTGLRRLKYPNAEEIAIVCFNPDCRWNLESSFEPLPFLIIDRDIYRHAPAVVLGVIDKLALIAQHPSTIGRVLGMFGLARWMERGTNRLVSPSPKQVREGCEQHGCDQLQPSYHNGRDVFVDPYPSLIIQDEAHLLEESLGTFAGLFETLLEELFVRSATILGDRVARQPFGERRPRLPKVIAATATVSVPQQQFGALYQRKHMRFPYPGTSIYRSFYTVPAIASRIERHGLGGDNPMAPEIEAPWMRVYVSIMTNGRNHTVTTVSVLSAYHLAITELWRDLQNEACRAAAVSRLLQSLSANSVLSGFHSEAISFLYENSPAVLLTLVDLMRISLTYVTNKKGGDQVIDAFRDEVLKVHRSHGRDLKQLLTRLISGGVDVAEIQEIMREAEGEQCPGDEFPELELALRNIVATSAISHGVDVDKFNAMFFAGMPNDIAEFIQASSRVGRSHVGFCMLIPTPHARRDRYIIETHDIFHRFLERMIAPSAITRWAVSAHDRFLTSVFQAWLCGWVEQTIFAQSPDQDKGKVLTFQSVNDVSRMLEAPEYPSAVRDFMDFSVAALGVYGRGLQHIGASPRPDFYEARIRNQSKQLIEQFRTQYTTTRLSDYWEGAAIGQRPMTSLRDIDEAGQFVLTREFTARRLAGIEEKRILRSALRVVRNQNGRVAELDDDDEGQN